MFPRRWFSGLWWTSYTSIGWTFSPHRTLWVWSSIPWEPPSLPVPPHPQLAPQTSWSCSVYAGSGRVCVCVCVCVSMCKGMGGCVWVWGITESFLHQTKLFIALKFPNAWHTHTHTHKHYWPNAHSCVCTQSPCQKTSITWRQCVCGPPLLIVCVGNRDNITIS